MSIEFLITSLIVVATPGTGVLYTLAAGLSRGARASVVAAFGCTLGIVPHLAAAILGVAALLHTSAVAFQTLKYLGVAYLLYMAWNTLREQGALKVEPTVDSRSAGQVIVSAILIPGVDLRSTQVVVHMLITHVMIQRSLPRPASVGCGTVGDA